MTAAMRRELYLLRRYCGVSAREALDEIPAWEYDLLLDGLAVDAAADPNPDPGV